MITKQTAAEIVFAYSEIEAGEKLLSKIEEDVKRANVPDLRDAFGDRRHLQLGVPTE